MSSRRLEYELRSGGSVDQISAGMQVELQHRALLQPGVDERIVVVRDDEPTSLLAYALSSRQAMHVLLHVIPPCGKGNLEHKSSKQCLSCSTRR